MARTQPQPQRRRIVQIIPPGSGISADGNTDVILALDSNGALWALIEGKWERAYLPPLPNT